MLLAYQANADMTCDAQADIARGFEEAHRRHAADQMPARAEATGNTRLVIAGGVGANKQLRAAGRRREARRIPRLFPAPGILHRQRRDDRARRRVRLQRGPAAERSYAFNVRPRWPLAAA